MKVLILLGLILVGLLFLGGHILRFLSAYPADEKLIREYFQVRGQKLLKLAPRGAEFSRHGPFVKYVARTEHQGTPVDHIMGVEGLGLGEPRLWMYHPNRPRERVQ